MTSTTGASALSTSAALDLGSHTNNPVFMEANPEPKVNTTPEYEGVPLFEPGDGDVQISVNGARFETHKYLIKRFRGLKILLDRQPSEITIQRDDISAEDLSETFKVLYASVVTGPFEFTSPTLVSTLRLATVYEYQVLRDYCIKHLEKLKLDAIKRIELAHEFHIPEWEKPAYGELASRNASITKEEAKIIGFDAFVSIVEMREKEQQRQWKEMNAAGGEQDGQSPVTPLVDENSTQDNASNGSQVNTPHAVPSRALPPHNNEQKLDDKVIYLPDETEIEPPFAGLKLSGLGGWKTKHGYVFEVTNCKRRFTDQDGLEQPGRACLISPCVISALKIMQTQQRAHTDSLFSLQSSMRNVESSVSYLESTVSDIESSVSDLESSLSTIKSSVSDLESTVSYLENRY